MTHIFELDANNAGASEYLGPYVQSGNINFLIGSGASCPAIKVAGTIEGTINELLKKNKEKEANQKCVDFIAEISAVHEKMSKKSDAEVVKVADSYNEFLAAVDRILFARKNLLLPRQANIFTTNYDMFLEYAASSLPAIILNDGFDRSSSVNQEFMFAPERYFDRTYRSGPTYSHQIEIPTINLVKLHGSLSWRKSSDTVAFNPTLISPLSDADKNDPAKVDAFLQKHFLILPNFKKHHSTLMERVYYDLLRLFSKAMDQQNVILVSFGFSFADEHILDVTRRALRNPTAQLIIFAFDNTLSNDFASKFAKQRNVTVIVPQDGEKIDFARLTKILCSVQPSQPDAAA